MQKYDYFIAPWCECGCYLKEVENGRLVKTTDVEAALAEKDSRIAELESALRLNLAVSPDDPMEDNEKGGGK